MALVVGAIAIVTGVGVPPIGLAEPEAQLQVVSSRAEVVSGGDALVRLSAPGGSRWVVRLNGSDVSDAFRPIEGSEDRQALLGGLKIGKNALELRIDGTVRSRLALVNHPVVGPIVSGPHLKPFICQTETDGLGPAIDSDCQAQTIVQYYYKSKEPTPSGGGGGRRAPGSLTPGFKPYDPSGPMPTDVAQIVTADGGTVNYIVRRELGTLNRAVYDIQFLHQPGQPLPSPWTRRPPQWNGRLVVTFPGGCGSGHVQGSHLELTGRRQEPLLAQGYAVATSTFNVLCDDRISAETLSMVKEHFTKEFGEPVHTIGWGGSGGALQVQLIAQNYPGLLDGIIAYFSFPDILTTLQSVSDCPLLTHALDASRHHWTEEQKTAVTGFATLRTCSDGWSLDNMIDPRHCDPLLRDEDIYDPLANRDGARCDLYDDEINIFGRNPRTGFVRRPLDNVGVQYGLLAFEQGKIDAEQFLDLNEHIGGYNEDGDVTASRTEADPEALHIAYERGLILTGGGGLRRIPIIDWRKYSDDSGDLHDRFRSFVTRARLIAANGHADNQVILVDPRYMQAQLVSNDNWNDWDALYVDRERDLVPRMDRWLDNIAADKTAGSMAEKVVRNRPSDLADGCQATDGEWIAEPATYHGVSRCNQLYPAHADPRMAAGGPLTDDILKCALKPLDPADYSHPLNPAQLVRLKAIFPDGVCDYRRPGIGQTATRESWPGLDPQ
jgi:hypothetical protein